MKKISSFTISNSESFKRVTEPVNVAIPFPKGLIQNHSNIKIFEKGKSEPLNSNSIITANWNDDSIKWLNVEFYASIASKENCEYELCEQSSNNEYKDTPLFISDEKSSNLGKLLFLEKEQVVSIQCIDNNNKPISFNQHSEKSISSNSFKNVTELIFKANCNSPVIELLVRIHEFKESKIVKIETVIKNLSAAVHPGEFWDLNDAGSLFFKELSLIIENEKGDLFTYTVDSNAPDINTFSSDDFNVVQQSSGGDKWDCKTHIAADNKNYRKNQRRDNRK